MDESQNIDIVILWVDGNDENWLKEKEKYSKIKDVSRYRDWDNLQYLFRGIENYMPWVRKIHFVTWGHIPKWLNTDNEKINVVRHEDFIPSQYLPTFNSSSIELNLDKIRELSENFIYFNDDMFVMKKMKKSDFFVNNLPRDSAIMNAISNVPGWEKESKMQFNNAGILNRHFVKKDFLRRNLKCWLSPRYGKQLFRNIVLLPWPYFTGFYSSHLPSSLNKSTLKKIWKLEYDNLDRVCRHKFRSDDMLNQWLFSEWQMVEGKFVPRNPNIGKAFKITDNEKKNIEIFTEIKAEKYKLICLNDCVYDNSFEKTKEELKLTFDKLFPIKSSFER